MERCRDCRYRQDTECRWFLNPIKIISWTGCYVSPNSNPNYPLVPTPTRKSRQFKYPEPHGHCFVCGRDLSGRQRHYCSAGHRQMYAIRYSWEGLRELIWLRDETTCCICNTPLSFVYEAEIDHIIPVALGGDYWDPDNLQTLCHHCHSEKSGRDRVEINTQKWKDGILIENHTLDAFLEGIK